MEIEREEIKATITTLKLTDEEISHLYSAAAFYESRCEDLTNDEIKFFNMFLGDD